MSDPLTISFVIPSHNEEDALPITMPPLAARLERLPGSEILIVENGSSDRTGEVAAQLAAALSTGAVTVHSVTSEKGYGNAARVGIEMATATRIMLTAADLPFGFTDLDAALALSPLPEIVIGSKAHHETRMVVSRRRKVMSRGFRVLRRALLRVDVGDSQGSINVDRVLAQSLVAELRSGAYFFTTELVVLAAHRGGKIVEVPVDYSNPRADSKVRPVQDSMDVLRDMWSLRKRLRASTGAR